MWKGVATSFKALNIGNNEQKIDTKEVKNHQMAMGRRMDVMAVIVKKIIYPLIEWKNKSKILKYLKEYEKSQFLSREEIERLQWEKLKALLEHAYKNVPFYNEHFRLLGIIPEDIRSPSDFLLVPPLTKQEIQDNFLKMLSKDTSPEKLIEDYTGGSTGKPLKFYYDEQRNQIREASRIRHNRWAGWDIGEKIAVLWGASSNYDQKKSVKRRLKEAVVVRSLFLDAFNLSVDKMEDFAKNLESFKPKTILAYAHSIYIFSRFIRNNKYYIRPAGIICSAENLSSEKRDLIESVFGCKVFDRYGCREIGLLASECERHVGLHINAENVYIEIVKGNKLAENGELGEVVVTDLFNYAMPFIRYKIGDIAIASSEICSCGRGLPLIKSIRGRDSDFIVTPEGKIICDGYFDHLFYGEEGVEKFQIIQEEENSVILNFVPSERYSEQGIINIQQQIQEHLGNDVHIEIRKVQEIPKTPSGKYRSTISNVPLPF